MHGSLVGRERRAERIDATSFRGTGCGGDELELEAQKPDVLTQNATLMALAAFWIADRPERFASPWPAERTARMLHAQHQYEELKAFNLWPYGDLGAEDENKTNNLGTSAPFFET